MLIKNMITVILAVIFTFPTYGLDPKIVDSLQLLIDGATTAAEKFEPLFELTFEYSQKDNCRALDLIKQAEEVALRSEHEYPLESNVEEKTAELQMIGNDVIEFLEIAIGKCHEHNVILKLSTRPLLFAMKDLSGPVELSFMQAIDKITGRVET